MVLLAPFLNLLHHRYGSRCWLIGSGPWSTQLYMSHPDVARIWSLLGRHTPFLLGPAWWRMLWALRNSGNAPIYVCETPASQRLDRIKGLLALARVEAGRCVFLGEDTVGGSEHRIDALLRFGRQTPSSLPAEQYPSPQAVDPSPRLHLLDQERLRRDAWITARGWSGRPIIMVHPGNRRSQRRPRRNRTDEKAWPLSNWNALLQGIHASQPRAQIVLCGTRQEQSMLRRIRLRTQTDSVAAVCLPLRQLIALCEVADCMISVDSGPAHIAAAVGSPLVVLFGKGSPLHWCPRSPCGAPVIPLGGPPESRHVDQISVETVLEAWRALPMRQLAPYSRRVSPLMAR
jgi:heptosyltransferase-2/heptosyltransferase-3